MEPRASRPSASAALLAVVAVAGSALYGYVLTTVDLPEEWGFWLGGAVVLGLLIGRWYTVLGALATLALPLDHEGGGAAEVTVVTIFVYLPAAALGIALGVGIREAIRMLTRRKARA
jgi:hypothetical protein